MKSTQHFLLSTLNHALSTRHFDFLLLTFGLLCATAAAHPGVGIVMDSRGSVFYTDLSHVWKIAPGGAKSIAVRGVHTHELYIDREDNLYGEHLWYEGDRTKKWGHRVWKLAADGKLSDVIPAREGFLQNYSFVRDGRGNMYWAERGAQTMLRKRTPSGQIETVGPVDIFRDIRLMTCTAEGTIYLIDGHDLRRVGSEGTVHTVARDLGERKLLQFLVGDRHILMGLWTDTVGGMCLWPFTGRAWSRRSTATERLPLRPAPRLPGPLPEDWPCPTAICGSWNTQ